MFAYHVSLQCHDHTLSWSARFLASFSALHWLFHGEGDSNSLFHYPFQDIFKMHISCCCRMCFPITSCFTNGEERSGIASLSLWDVPKDPGQLGAIGEWGGLWWANFYADSHICTMQWKAVNKGAQSKLPLSFPVLHCAGIRGCRSILAAFGGCWAWARHFLVPTWARASLHLIWLNSPSVVTHCVLITLQLRDCTESLHWVNGPLYIGWERFTSHTDTWNSRGWIL